jgi:hypothetical protein
VPGVNCQEATRDALIDSLTVTLREALDFNRADALAAAGDLYSEEKIAVPSHVEISNDLGKKISRDPGVPPLR